MVNEKKESAQSAETQKCDVVNLRRDLDRVIRQYRPTKEELHNAIEPILKWYGLK